MTAILRRVLLRAVTRPDLLWGLIRHPREGAAELAETAGQLWHARPRPLARWRYRGRHHPGPRYYLAHVTFEASADA
jgi:hypothetical protein